MGDPCECFFDHEAAMQRLLSLLRDNQHICTDSNCTSDGLPGVAGTPSLMIWTMMWAIMAMGLYFLRPNSMRSGSNQQNEALLEKPTNSGGGNNNDQPPPPPPPVL
ncbi:unnamed protein product [Caenorhabditis bovis]|uniref:Small integral membrane protein 14 n=1 Tax=Caenorhabditis bovis TaxID=2654633 RepID=A0A8S1EU28_9PELO|nr:unnamed protein product [Caenorhabditis bovis]